MRTYTPGINHTHGSRFWAVGIVFVLTIIFGLFWYIEQQQIRNKIPEIDSPRAISHTEKSSEQNDPANVSDLETSAVNIPIPDFSTMF